MRQSTINSIMENTSCENEKEVIAFLACPERIKGYIADMKHDMELCGEEFADCADYSQDIIELENLKV